MILKKEKRNWKKGKANERRAAQRTLITAVNKIKRWLKLTSFTAHHFLPFVLHYIFFLKGQYLYVESSEPRRFADRAILTSGLLKGLQCMRFRYYMFGQDMGSLSVYRVGDGIMRGRLWRRYGNQGDKWHEARITLPCNSTSYMVRPWTFAHRVNFLNKFISCCHASVQ